MKSCAVFGLLVALVMGSPVPQPSSSDPNTEQCANCTETAILLLNRLKDIIDKDGKMTHPNLFPGFNCTEQEPDMIPHTVTAVACQPTPPADTSCPNQRNSPFSAIECLRNIQDDLRYYESMLSSYLYTYSHTRNDLTPVATATKNLMNCFKGSCHHSEEVLPKWRVYSKEEQNTFNDRLSLCKSLKGFHVRAITMNRALRYITSGDYRK